MACGGCAKRRASNNNASATKTTYDIMGGYANLTDRQIKARLEVYKRKFCADCRERYTCDFARYTECRKLNVT